ncbi:6054_t:CDS:2, partial [Scutellospora calospora]
LKYYEKDLTEEKLQTCANMMTASIDLSLETDIFNTNNIFDTSETKLNIEDIADLTLLLFNFNNTELYYKNLKLQSKLVLSKSYRNIDFKILNIVDKVLGIETDNN